MAPKFSKNGKRLGRPPKNKSAVVFINNPPPQEEIPITKIDYETMIECEFVPIPQSSLIATESSPKKLGLYSSTFYSVDGLNNDKWAVVAYLKADFDKHRKEGLTDKAILQRCFNFLNIVPERKKYAKKQPVARFGKLSLLKEEVKFINKFNCECAIVIFTTDQRKCELFWGEGER